MSRQEIVKPDWLVPGAEVVLYSTGSDRLHIRRDRVKKVAGQSFTVEGEHEPRFRISRMEASCGSDWSSYWRRVVPLDSDKARELLAMARRQRLISNVDSAYEDWRRDRGDEKLAMLRDAVSRLSGN